jgi:hypothetical protein
MFLEGLLSQDDDESFFSQLDISTPVWRERFGTNLLGISISLTESLDFSDGVLKPFRMAVNVTAVPMYEDPVHTPEPGTYTLFGPAFVICMWLFGRKRRAVLSRVSPSARG